MTQIDFDAGAASSCEEGNTIFTSDQRAALEAASSCEDGKTIFTSDQRAALEAKFRRKKYPTRQEKDKLASKLGIGISIVQVSLEKHANLPAFLFVRICLIH